MPFASVDTKVDFPALEREVLAFWKRSEVFDKLRRQNAGNKKWSFLDGPITANNPMGVHHALGRTYKDVYQRFFAALGYDQRYQNGFDCQGLWVEVEVERELGFTNKKQIEEYGVDKFVNDCKARVRKFAAVQTEQTIRLGNWMDWENSYYTMSEENNYAIWGFLRKCHDQGLVYKSTDSMPWCPRCGTGLSQMEMTEGYKNTVHASVFVKLPIRERPGENLLVWTTTPWTLSANVAAAVRPGMTYVKVRHGDDIFYVGKGNFENARKHPVDGAEKENVPGLSSIQATFKGRGGFEIIEELDGKALVGLTYDGPFDHLPAASEAAAAHRVVEWNMVTETEGSGIVHIAPGCGAEDHALCKTLGLPIVAPLGENGEFLPEFEWLTGQGAGDVADEIIADLKKRNLLVAREAYLHRYPHCWRCGTELVYRLVNEWFIKMDWRERIMDATRMARWIPEWGLERELDWLRNMSDWMISKKRYWGLALPIWECDECSHFEVLGTRDELQSRAVSGWKQFDGHTPHRPWIDGVKIKCEKCGSESVSRIKDVGNPWLDASIVAFSTMGYFRDRDYWEQWFPADFVVESLAGQFRNWFYALLAVSTMMEGRSPFKTLLGHGLVLDDTGKPMHKSAGNAIDFSEAAETIGVDVMRWMYCNHPPERNLLFGPKHASEIRRNIVIPLWNVYAFFCNYAALDKFDPAAERIPVKNRSDLDRWIISDLQLLVRTARKELTEFNVFALCGSAERFIDHLSTWYIRRSRRRFWKSEWSDDKRAAYQTLHEVLTTLNQILAPILVFLSETIYKNLVADQMDGSPESVHLNSYPEVDESLIDHVLSERVAALIHTVSLARSARTAAKLKVRQPLAEIQVVPGHDATRAAVEQFTDHLLDELNIKKVTILESADDRCVVEIRPNKKLLGAKYGKLVPAITKALADADAKTLAAKLSAGEPASVSADGQEITLEPAEVIVTKSYGDDWAAAEGRETIVLLDKRITTELKLEGLARDVVRNVQNLRKTAELNIEDRIELSLQTESPQIQAAIGAFKDYIANETLALRITMDPLADGAASVDAQIEGDILNIALRRLPGSGGGT